jgi:hypothetical protein
MHSNNNVFMDELFSLLWKELLAKENKMPTTSYEALKLIKNLGLSYESIHGCVNVCVFSEHLKPFASVSKMWHWQVCGWVKVYSTEGLSKLPTNSKVTTNV